MIIYQFSNLMPDEGKEVIPTLGWGSSFFQVQVHTFPDVQRGLFGSWLFAKGIFGSRRADLQLSHIRIGRLRFGHPSIPASQHLTPDPERSVNLESICIDQQDVSEGKLLL